MKERHPLTAAHRALAEYIETNAPGKARAISLPQVAAHFGVGTRDVQTLKAEPWEWCNILICSSTSKPAGLYWPKCVEDVLPYYRQQGNRAKASGKVCRGLERRWPALKETRLRTPPRTIRPSVANVGAQRRMTL